MPQTTDLDGRQAVITGGAAGLGLAIARRFAAMGAAITLIDLEAAFASASIPNEWHCHAIDLGADDSLGRQTAVAEACERVDIVVANAGVVPPWRRVAELDAAEWQRVMAINSWGVAATLGAFSGALAASGRGSAIVMASINGYRAHPEQVLYTASKHAAIGVMRSAALDLGPRGVRVNALAPGPVATAALRERIEGRARAGGPEPETALASMRAETALGRMVTEDNVADAAAWLASDASAGTTGVVLPVEAGLR
ncbi:MAG: SDR family oxidoreductase [Halieaceae bacterium]|jgi:NAD(P)-dependent dehydrogenase (short-subunit alcohol dehydrogenase family)|nr:SDR family oxidoreductase [Halieaceae bacterium]